MTSINKFEQIHTNLYRNPTCPSIYYRLFAHSITPNGCWLTAPELRRVIDIDVATGKDVYNSETIELGSGMVPSCLEFIAK